MRAASTRAGLARLLITPLAVAIAVTAAAHATASPSRVPSRHASHAGRTPVVRARSSAPVVPADRPSVELRTTQSTGMVVGIDPATGRLIMPEPEQMARIAARRASAATTAHAAPVLRADGSRSLDVRSWMRDYSIVRLGPNGRAVVDCLEGHDVTARTLHQAPAPALEER
jgi:hypothetical protein